MLLLLHYFSLPTVASWPTRNYIRSLGANPHRLSQLHIFEHGRFSAIVVSFRQVPGDNSGPTNKDSTASPRASCSLAWNSCILSNVQEETQCHRITSSRLDSVGSKHMRSRKTEHNVRANAKYIYKANAI